MFFGKENNHVLGIPAGDRFRSSERLQMPMMSMVWFEQKRQGEHMMELWMHWLWLIVFDCRNFNSGSLFYNWLIFKIRSHTVS